MSTIEFY